MGSKKLGTATDQVFFDPSGLRSKLLLCVSISLAVTFLVVTSSLIRSIVVMPRLPELALSAPRHVLAAAARKRAVLQVHEAPVDLTHSRHPIARTAAKVKRYGFLVPWDDNSFSSLKRHADALDVVVGEWLHLADADGTISVEAPHKVDPVLKWLASNAPNLEVMPLVNNFLSGDDAWQGAMAAKMIASRATRAKFTAEMMDYIVKYHLPGAVIDIESVPAASNDDFVALIREAAPAFHNAHLKLLVAVPVDGALDYGALAEASDGLMLMTYDQHSEDAEPGPIAGQAWFEGELDKIFNEIDGAKLIVGIGSYGYDWSGTGHAQDISVQDAWTLLADSEADLSFDPVSLNPTFSYRDDDSGKDHTVWYLDAATAYNQIAAALAMDAGGIALWRLGSEDPNVWSIIGRNGEPDAGVVEQLKTIPPGYDVAYKGSGEVLRVTGGRKPGTRTLDFDPASNLITDETLVEVPSVTTITRWGATKDKLIAISFDDGPDPKFTPQILEILREKNVKASFFIIGSNAAAAPDLLRRIHDEGHDIGNHTFTHPDLSEVSSSQIDLELNATQRLFEATLGVRTLLFRPPYAQDIEPETVDQARALTNATALGYTTIGYSFDPLDWAMPATDEIVRRTLLQVKDGGGGGGILLLHDAGGDRKATVAALPVLIDRLRGEGYRFVPVHELLGLTREAVMPATLRDHPVVVELNAIAFDAFRRFNSFLGVLLITALVLGSARLVMVTFGAVTQKTHERARRSLRWRPASVAALVPAYNEEKVIRAAIEALLASTLPPNEVIVIDDGSSDRTAEVVTRAFADHPEVKLLRKANGGKASAINAGLTQTAAEIVVVMDADTLFAPDALEQLVRHFENPKTGAVAGSTLVGNRINLLTRFQALEYITSQNLDRRALEIANGITVVPGAIGAWRRTALTEIGGFPRNTLAEDADATISLERAGWRVLTEPRAVARTEAPQTLRAFAKQRLRWMFGTLQVAYKHCDAVRRRDAAGVAYAALPNIVVFQFLLTAISPIMDIMLFLMLISGIRCLLMHPADPLPETLVLTASYWLALQLLELACVAVAFLLEGRRAPWHLLPLIPVQRFCYRQLISYVAIKTIVAAIRGRLVGWNKLKRTGEVLKQAQAPASS